MKTSLRTDITVEQLCEGFVYNEHEGKGLFGLSGKLVIQPEYQRNYLYASDRREEAVIDSLLKGYPIGLLYFVKTAPEQFEVLDGQQRITSIGRFLTGKFAIPGTDGVPRYFDGLPADQKAKILQTRLTIYECEGEESEIKEWFRTINIAGIPLNEQELSNAIHSGPFVTLAKAEYSNSRNANLQKWAVYISGDVKRQDFLRTALEWVSNGKIDDYMSRHRFDDSIEELKAHFTSVIDWASGLFRKAHKEMRHVKWGELYTRYHATAYDPKAVQAKVEQLYADYFVRNRRGIFEYILDGCRKPQLLEVRVFEEPMKKQVYARQTKEAEKRGVSNCPLCAAGSDANRTRIYDFSEMEADHVTAWSKGGRSDERNCQMLCRTHNRAKGNA